MAKSDAADSELLAQIEHGNARAKERLMRRYVPLVNWHARRAATDSSQYDDFQQEAMIGLMRAIDSYNPSSGVQFNTYATTCITNALISLRRKLARHHEIVVDEHDEHFFENIRDTRQSDEPLAKIMVEELRADLSEKLSALELEALFYHAEGYSYKEIAALTNMEAKQVANALARAHAKLKNF